MIANVEILLRVSANSLDDADELGEFICKDVAERFGPLSADPDNVPPGIIASASVEAVALARGAAA